jgi:hypothetical protein
MLPFDPRDSSGLAFRAAFSAALRKLRAVNWLAPAPGR